MEAEHNCYTARQTENGYLLLHDGQPMLTREGKTAAAPTREIAVRVLGDLRRWDTESRGASCWPWLSTYLDAFAEEPPEDSAAMIDDSFLDDEDWPEGDWTFDLTAPVWVKRFGYPDKRRADIRQWLLTLTPLSLCAACCLGNAEDSLNLAYTAARLLESLPADRRDGALKDLADELASANQTFTPSAILRDLRNFALFYGASLPDTAVLTEPDDDAPLIEDDRELLDALRRAFREKDKDALARLEAGNRPSREDYDEIVFHAAVLEGDYDYVSDHADDVPLNDESGRSPYYREAVDPDIRLLLRDCGAVPPSEDYIGCAIAIDTVDRTILTVSEDFRDEVIERFLANCGIPEKRLAALLNEDSGIDPDTVQLRGRLSDFTLYDAREALELEVFGDSVLAGEWTADNDLSPIIEALGWRFTFDGVTDEDGEQKGVRYIE